MLKMVTYPGMNLRGEVRESISLDEDDISDDEDEVFIRDRKNGYKFAEDLNVKRPLMAPRRKLGKSDLSTRIKPKPPCRAFCKPCCYVLAALSVLIGLIALVVVLVSIYPLPLDKLRDWVITKPNPDQFASKLLPCTNLKVLDVWTVTLPKLTTDSPIRTVDVNGDNVEDILFGFGTGDNEDILPPDILCSIFMGVSPPCDGGIIALDGVNGDIIWRHWMNDTIFNLHCTADINGDNITDCLAVGVEGTIAVVNSKTGKPFWKLNTGKMNIFVANFIDDINNDNVSDIITSHSSLEDKKDGHIVLISGKNGDEIKRIKTPQSAKTYFMPQILTHNENETFVLIGTGSPTTPGNFSVISLTELAAGSLNNSKVIYRDNFKGILTQAVLVDITGDGVPDIISAMYNSTVVAIDGQTFEQIWNYTVVSPNSETNIVPTPGYFNFDNITDFLIIYQKYDSIFNNNYTQTYIIDGKTGQPIYNPMSGGLLSQMGGLTLSMEDYGYDFFLFWSQCQNTNSLRKNDLLNDNMNTIYDECKIKSNMTTILKLNALNQNNQPPGFLLYNTEEKLATETNLAYMSAMSQLRKYIRSHPGYFTSASQGQAEVQKNYNLDPSSPIGITKYGKSNFRHKGASSDIAKDFLNNQRGGSSNKNSNEPIGSTEDQVPFKDPQVPYQTSDDYWDQNRPDNYDSEFSNYPIDVSDGTIPYNQKPMLYADAALKHPTPRDPRSKEKKLNKIVKINNSLEDNINSNNSKSRKKNLSDKIYSYSNTRLSKNRLLHDADELPVEILSDTYFKNEENRLKKSKFEQRDIGTHRDKSRDNQDVKNIIEGERLKFLEERMNKNNNNTVTLWDLENEKEAQDRENGFYGREKRRVSGSDGVSRVTSVGAILDSLNTTNSTNSIDLVFIKYWLPGERNILAEDIEECISEKQSDSSSDQAHAEQKLTAEEQQKLFRRECVDEQKNLKQNFNYFDRLKLLKLGQMTVYRVKIECECDRKTFKSPERCARFLKRDAQRWPQYLGRKGDGVF